MSVGQGNVTFSSPGPGTGPPFEGARNGVSLDSAGNVVLGEEVSGGSGADLLDSRLVPMDGNQVNWSGGISVFSDVLYTEGGESVVTITRQTPEPSIVGEVLLNLTTLDNLAGGDGSLHINATNTGVVVMTLSSGGELILGDGVTGPDRQSDTANTSADFSLTGYAQYAGAGLFAPPSGVGTFATFLDNNRYSDTGGSVTVVSYLGTPTINRNTSGDTRFIYFAPTIFASGIGTGSLIAFENTVGDVHLCSQGGSDQGRVVIGTAFNKEAWLTLSPGAAAANSAPLCFLPGLLNTTPQDGCMEFDGSHLYFSIGATRHTLI